MKDAKNVQWKSVFEYVLNLLRCSEPNAFGYCGTLGLSEAIHKCEKRWVTLSHRILNVVRLLERNVKLYIIW